MNGSKFAKTSLLLALILGWTGVLSFSSCEQSTTQPATAASGQAQSLPTVTMTLGKRPFVIEVAAEDKTREIGLMYRDSMAADHGMIFVFPEEQRLSFWMKNTRIPLEIIYLDKDAKVITILQMRPFDLTGIDSLLPAKYAIELNPGAAEAAEVHPGDVIAIPPNVSSAGR